MVELQIVVLVVAGSSPVGHPTLLPPSYLTDLRGQKSLILKDFLLCLDRLLFEHPVNSGI